MADGHAAIANGEGKEKFKLGSIVSDGQWHYVSMRRDGSQIKVTLDDGEYGSVL